MTSQGTGETGGATPLTPEELDGLIPETLTTQAELNEWEQVNIQEADAWAFSRPHSDLLTIMFAINLHRRMLGNVWKWAGQFRTSDKNIGIHWPDIPAQLMSLCGDCAYWLEHSTYPTDEIAARFHHRLVYIHPFPNGNGRHARMMADLILHSVGTDRFSWGGGISRDQQDKIRAAYIAALRLADEGDYSTLIEFVRS